MTLVDEAVAHLARDVGLRAPDQPAARDRLDDAVRRVCRLAQQLDLLLVLDRAQVRQDVGGQSERGVREDPLQPQKECRPQPIRHKETTKPAPRSAEDAELDLWPALARREQLSDDLERVLGLLPADEIDEAGLSRRGRLCSGKLEARDDQGGASLGRHDEHRQALERMGRVAGQPLEVSAHTDQQRRGILAW